MFVNTRAMEGGEAAYAGGASTGAASPAPSTGGQTGGAASPSTAGSVVIPPLGTPLRTINVSNASQLSSALSSAQPGDHIVLGNGTYSGSFSVSRNGTSQNPIVIRSANPLGAQITSRMRIGASYNILQGIHFNGGGIDFEGAQNTRVTRSHFNNITARAIHARNSSAVLIDYNEFSSRKGLNSGVANAVTLRRTNRNFEIAYNYIRDFPYKTANYSDIAISSIMTGFGPNDYPTNTAHFIHHNLHINAGSAEMEIKSTGNRIENNTIIGESGPRQSYQGPSHIRLIGNNNLVQGNWVENAYGFQVKGDNNRFLCNTSQGSNFRVKATFNDSAEKPPGTNTLLANNVGTIIVGHHYGSEPNYVENTAVQNHSGSVELRRQRNTTQTGGGPSCQPARKLDVSDVGLGASER